MIYFLIGLFKFIVAFVCIIPLFLVGMFQELGGAGDDDTVLAKFLCWLTGVKI